MIKICKNCLKEYIFKVNNLILFYLIYWLILYLFELLFFKIKANFKY